MSKEPKIVDSIADARKRLWIFGLYHGNRLPKYASFNIRRVIVLTITFAPILVTMKIFLDEMEFSATVKAFSFLWVALWMTCRTWIFVKNLPKMQMIEDQIENGIFSGEDSQTLFIPKLVTYQMVISRIYFAGTFLCTTFIALQPLVTKKFRYIPTWTPLSGDKGDVMAYTFHIIYMMIPSTIYGALDCVLVGLVNIMVVQIKILKKKLENPTSGCSGDHYANQHHKIENRVKKCILYHNIILDFANRLEDLFSTTFFCQIVFGVLEVCFSGMQLVVSREPMQVIYWMVLFIFVLGEMAVSCWCSQEIINESSGIIEACYMSEWHTCTPSTRKMVFIIMERAKTPIALTAGPFFTLSFEIYMNILRSAYSYYVVFTQMYKH